MLLLLFASGALAQETTARLSGTVTDSSGAVISGSSVVVTNENTKAEVARSLTDSSGTFVALQLPAGEYSLTVAVQGFKSFTLSHILLSVAQRLQVPITLQPGNVSTNVEVAANSQPPLENSTSTLSTLITPTQVRTLPLPNRDITQLIALTPGVVLGGTATSLNNSQLSINGSRTLGTEVLLDGTSVINGSTGNINRLPSLDDLDEFRVITSTASAEYGRTSGGVIIFGTRYGTSAFHGGVYELFRNAAMDANSYFNKLNGAPRPVDNFNQFGATFGGPVWIPHLYDGRKKTFFYLNYDQTVQHQPGVSTVSVPSAAFRSGDFSSSPVIVNDPLTHTPFPNNIIPASRIDPAAAAVLAQEPLPNTTGTFDAVSNRFSNNYFTQQSLASTQPIYSGRIDQAFGDKTRMFISATREIDPIAHLVLFNDLLNGSYQTEADQGWETSIGFTHEFTPTLVLNLNFGASRDVGVRIPTSLGSDPAQTFKIGTAPALLTPNLNVTGFQSVGTGGGAYSRTYSNGFNYYGSVTKLLGPHTIKVGASLRKNQLNIFNPGVLPGGAYNFTGEITDPRLVGGTATNGLADFLLGAVKTSSYGLAQPPDGRRNYNIGIYGQDDYRISPKLLLNAGLRYEYESPMTISNNQYSRIDPGTGTLLVAGQNASNALNITTPKLDFAPRVGLIFSPNDKTVVRAGFGTYYGGIFSNLGGQVGFPGYEVVQSFNNLGTGVAQPFTLSQGQPLIGVAHLTDPAAVVAAGTVSSPYNPSSVSFAKLSPLSQIQQWNLGIQQDIFKGTVLEIDYVGSHGVHLPLVLANNLPNPALATQVAFANNTVTTQEARPFPTLGQFPSVYNVGGSNYHSLQVIGRRQLRSGFTVSGSYTWSHSIDDGSGIYNYSQPNGLNGGQYPQDPAFRRTRDRSSSALDIRNNFQESASYTTKGPWYTRNFLFGETAFLRSGFPLTITQTSEFPGVGSQRPNGSSIGLKVSQYKNGNGVQYFMPANSPNFPLTPSGPIFVGSGAARTQVSPTSFGTLGRYSIYGPGAITVNASVARTVKLHESVNVQFRVDAFNLANHVNYSPPNSGLTVTTPGNVPSFSSSSTFGLITGSAPARFLQLVTRINF